MLRVPVWVAWVSLLCMLMQGGYIGFSMAGSLTVCCFIMAVGFESMCSGLCPNAVKVWTGEGNERRK